MKRDVLKYPLFAIAALALASLVSCGKEEPPPPGAVTTAPRDAKAPQPPSAHAPAATNVPESQSGETPVAGSAETDGVTEQVAETEEVPEIKDEPANKGAAPLKLAQLPPRVPAGSNFKEGVHYTRLSPTQPVTVSPDQVQIVEFFWYGCPHCYALDPRIEEWRKGASPGGKPDYVAFTRVPGAWSDIARFHGRFYFAAESVGKLDELHPLIFREIHVNGNPLNTLDKAREFFGAHGVDAAAFQKNFGAMSLERKLDEANTFGQRSRVTGVPAFVVNGKYTLDVSSAGGEEPLFVLLNELAAREHTKE